MKLLSGFSLLLSYVFIGAVTGKTADQTVTVYAWPPAAASPQELAHITFNADALSDATVSNFKPPSIPVVTEPSEESPLVRVGLYDLSTKQWRGIVTSANGFDPKYQQKIDLHLDMDGRPWHVGFSAYNKPKPVPKARQKGDVPEVVPQVVTEVIVPQPGPTPHLNKPVVLNPQGKVEEKEEQKTFLQKYWWMILIFLAVQVFAGGGGGGEK